MVFISINMFAQNEFPMSTNSNVKVDGGSIKMISPNTTGGWARGLSYYLRDATQYSAAMGFFGTASEMHKFYLAFGSSPWSSGNGLYMIPNGHVGIGTTNPVEKLSVQGGNISIANGESSTIYSSAHNLFFSGVPRGYAHKVYTFRPAWGTAGSTFSSLKLQTADTKGEFTTNVLLTSSGISYLNGGSLGIGTTNTRGFKLAVNGNIGADEIQVKANYWSDFVFNDDYKLKDLEEVESFIEENNHLPDIPSEKEVLKNGIQVGEMNAKLLQKIEELTLYMIEANKRINELSNEVDELKNK